jgi:hypothetical protein
MSLDLAFNFGFTALPYEGLYGVIGTWVYNFQTLFVTSIYPAVATFFMSRSLVNVQARKAWRLIFSIYMSAAVYLFIMTKSPGVVKLFLASKSDTFKIVVRLAMPIFHEMITFIILITTKTSKLQERRDDVLVLMPIKLGAALSCDLCRLHYRASHYQWCCVSAPLY